MVSPAPAPPSDADTNLMLDQVTRAAFCLLRQVSSYTKLYRVIPKMFWYNFGISMVFCGISRRQRASNRSDLSCQRGGSLKDPLC